MAQIRITPHIAIDESELEETFVLASGPGGQNVNKVSSAVQLRFNAALSLSPRTAKARLGITVFVAMCRKGSRAKERQQIVRG